MAIESISMEITLCCDPHTAYRLYCFFIKESDYVRFRLKEDLTGEEKANALQTINKRIAEVHQKREMSLKSNLVGNPAEPLSTEYSPTIAGAQGASLTIKQLEILVNHKYMIQHRVIKNDIPGGRRLLHQSCLIEPFIRRECSWVKQPQ